MPSDTARFKDVFTKLHACSLVPETLGALRSSIRTQFLSTRLLKLFALRTNFFRSPGGVLGLGHDCYAKHR